jgi:hypothetical protein
MTLSTYPSICRFDIDTPGIEQIIGVAIQPLDRNRPDERHTGGLSSPFASKTPAGGNGVARIAEAAGMLRNCDAFFNTPIYLLENERTMGLNVFRTV